MPREEDLVLAEIQRDATALHRRMRETGIEKARLERELRLAREQADAAERSGDAQSVRHHRARLDEVAARLEEARGNLAAIGREHLELVEGLANRDSCDAAPQVPLILLPVRVETRFSGNGTELRVRIYPDEIHVDRLEHGLSEEEVDAGQLYWSAVWAGGDAAIDASWRQLIATVGASRAHWVARQTRPKNSHGSGPPIFRNVPPRAGLAAMARLLPDRFVAIAEQGGQRSRAVGSTIPLDVRIGLLADNEDPLVTQKGLKTLAGTEWLSDFAAARDKGLALTIPLGRRGRVDRLVVAGVRRSTEATRASDELAELLDAHWASDGLAFLPQGTPTNNTEAVRSGWQRRTAHRPPPIDDPKIAAGSDAAVLSRALGLDAPWLALVEGGGGQEQARAAAMNTALWPATLGQFLHAVDKGNEAISPVVIEQVRQFHRDHVRGRGPLPTLRVGNQPYGLLPVSTFASGWKDRRDDRFGADLTGFLKKLMPYWRSPTAKSAHVGSSQDLSEVMRGILKQTAVSYGVRARRCLSGSALAAIGELTKVGEAASDIERLLTRMLEEAIGQFSYSNFGASLDDKSRPVLLPYADDARDGPFVKALLETGDGGNISSVFQALVALAADQVKQTRAPGNDFLDHLRATETIASATRESIVAHMTGDIRSGPEEIDRLRASLPGAEDPNARPAPRNFAMHGMRETSFASYFDSASSQVARDYLTVLVVDEFLRHSRLQAEFDAALTLLGGEFGSAANQARHNLVGETLDIVSHRLDAWITGAVSRRLEKDRGQASRGITIGAFGYVEKIEPAGGREHKGGYLLAPSLAHATAAGILRAAHLAHKPDAGGRNPYAVDLSSARVRDALHLSDGIRQGQPLGALLGYRLERRLQDAGYGHVVLNLRSLAPLVQGKLNDRGEALDAAAQEAIAASNVCDGLRVVEIWRGDGGPANIRAKLAARPVNNPYLPATAEWPALANDDWTKIDAAIRKLDESVDALADLTLAESVHQLAQGNLARVSATLDAGGRGDVAPPDPDFVASLRGGQPVSHRLIIVGRPGGWSTTSPRARVAPDLEGWAAERLGDPGKIVAGFDGQDSVRLAESSLSALDFVFLSADPSAALRRIAPGRDLDAATAGDARLSEGDLPFADAIVLANSLRVLVAAARRADATDFGLPGASSVHVPDPAHIASLGQVLGDLAALLKQRADALRALASATEVTADALEQALAGLVDFGVMTPTLPPDRLGDLAMLALGEADQKLAAYGALSDLPADAQSHGARAQALFGRDFVVPVRHTRSGPDPQQVDLDPVPPSTVRRYLSDIASVRPQVRNFTDHLLVCEALDVQAPLTVAQFGGTSAWVGGSLPKDRPTPDTAAISIVADAPAEAPETLCGLVVDDWSETLPRWVRKGEPDNQRFVLETTAALAINANAPNAQPPQAILLGVSPDGQRWTDDRVFDLVVETVDLARMRLVTLETVPLAARILPAIYTQSWSLQGEKTVDWSKFGTAFAEAALQDSPLRAFRMVGED